MRRWISWYVIRNFTASVLGNMLTGKWVMKAGKCIVIAVRRYNDMGHIDKIFSSGPFFKQYQDY